VGPGFAKGYAVAGSRAGEQKTPLRPRGYAGQAEDGRQKIGKRGGRLF